MSGQATLAEGQAEDFSAQLQGRIRAFTAFYEQHAYLAYNLALRIACEPEAAMRAVQGAFLTQLDDRPAGLLPATVAAALHEAPSRPSPGGAGDPQAEASLAATAELAPPERAALALADLAHAGPEGIAEALELDTEQAAKLLHRGREAFSARLGLPRTQADEAARSWIWAPPPDVIWEELYPQFHKAAERDLRRGSAEQTLVLSASEAAVAGAPSAPIGKRRRRRWSRRPRWGIVIPAVAILVAGGAAAAAQLSGRGSDSRDQGSGTAPAENVPGLPADSPEAPAAAAPPATGESQVKTHKPLTAAQLDKLRLRELAMLRKYTKRQADKRLSVAQRDAAAQRIEELQRAAQRRLSAQSKRDQAARDQAARQRAKAKAPPPPPPTYTQPAPTRTTAPKHQSTQPQDQPPTKTDADKTCLLDEDSGQYVCPQ